MIVRDSFSVFVYSTTKNGMSKFITCGLYFPASVDEAMSALSSYNRVEHNCEVTAGRVLHTCRNIHAADSQTMLLVFYRTCTDCDIGEKIGKITVILRIKHLICAGHAAGLNCMDMHFTDGDEAGKKVRLFFGIRLMHHTLIAFSCCSWFVCVNTWNDQNLVSYLLLNIA